MYVEGNFLDVPSFYAIWIFSQFTPPRDRPVTNVVALFVILLTTLPILLAFRLTQDSGTAEKKE